ncbi:hypothetical protein PFMG_04665 [Plasmodium falciparum IGH-CR14]|uniref:Uncharacterized protein n=1 Tax=Plasmodium falciparum IGH-CR14 TaxID=580059 RepID=A0A0L1IGR7_PLAFA|nr:hypothetical protein PFMG_04665 [Plasmodium falciparum IGH-CR14]
MKKVKDKTIISLFMYSISTTAIVYQNYIFISNLLKNYRAFEWLCIKNEDDNIVHGDFFVCNEQENYVQFLLILGFIIQFLSGSIGSVLIKIFSKKIIAQAAFIFLFFGWIILGTALSYSKYYVDNNITNKISLCMLFYVFFIDIYENNVFGETLNVYSLILPSSFIFTLIFGIIADVINISNFISFNLILGIFVYMLIYFYYTTANVTIGYISLVIYFFHQSFYANHMYMYMSTIFKQENFSILIEELFHLCDKAVSNRRPYGY